MPSATELKVLDALIAKYRAEYQAARDRYSEAVNRTSEDAGGFQAWERDVQARQEEKWHAEGAYRSALEQFHSITMGRVA